MYDRTFLSIGCMVTWADVCSGFFWEERGFEDFPLRTISPLFLNGDREYKFWRCAETASPIEKASFTIIEQKKNSAIIQICHVISLNIYISYATMLHILIAINNYMNIYYI